MISFAGINCRFAVGVVFIAFKDKAGVVGQSYGAVQTVVSIKLCKYIGSVMCTGE